MRPVVAAASAASELALRSPKPETASNGGFDDIHLPVPQLIACRSSTATDRSIGASWPHGSGPGSSPITYTITMQHAVLHPYWDGLSVSHSFADVCLELALADRAGLRGSVIFVCF